MQEVSQRGSLVARAGPPADHRKELATIGGLDQWPYEVTGGGRIWYVVEPDRKTVHLRAASTSHPKPAD